MAFATVLVAESGMQMSLAWLSNCSIAFVRLVPEPDTVVAVEPSVGVIALLDLCKAGQVVPP